MRSSLVSFEGGLSSSATVGVLFVEIGGATKLGKRSWIKFGKNDSILLQVISHRRCLGQSALGGVLWLRKLSKMP